MDKKEVAILEQLIHNSRLSLTQLAKNIKVSREVTTYHFNKLVQQGIIQEFVTHIDVGKLGFVGAAVFMNIKATKHKEFEGYLRRSKFVSWVAQHSGLWSFGLSIYGCSNQEVDQRFHELYTKFKDDIIDHRFALHKRSLFFYEKYLGLSSANRMRGSKFQYQPDRVDKCILKRLAHDSRMDNSAIAEQCKVSTPTVTRRIQKLEERQVIEQYSVFIDIRKLGLYQYSIFATNKNVGEKEELIKYLTQHPSVSFVAEYVGDPFFEFGIFVDDPYDLRQHLQDIEEQFPGNRSIDISLFQKEFISTGPPICVFE